MALIAPLPVWATECRQDVVQRITHKSPGTAPYVIAAVPVIESASGHRLVLLDSDLLDRNPWLVGDRISLCLDVRWPNFIAVTNLRHSGVLYFMVSRD